MKKFAILTLILVLFSLLLTLPALAEEEGTTVQAVQMDWNQEVIDAFTAAGFDGNMATITLADGLEFRMLIPEGFEQKELTEEEAQTGINLALINEETGTVICVRDRILEGFGDVGAIAQELLTQNPETAIQFAVVNGTTALISGLAAEDAVSIFYDLGSSRFVQFDFAPLEGNNQLAQFFITSVQF